MINNIKQHVVLACQIFYWGDLHVVAIQQQVIQNTMHYENNNLNKKKVDKVDKSRQY